MSNKRIRSVVEKIVGGQPSEKAFYKSAKSTYQNKAFDNIEGYEKIYDGKTIDGFLNPNSREILIGVRGTAMSTDDLKADVNIVSNNLKNTTRYKNDVNQINQIFQQYPPEQYNYYLGGHSLGSAIISQLKRDYPFLKDAVVFNGALQPVDISNQHKDMKFKYIDKDPLYNIVGKSVQNKEVLPYEELKRGSFFGRIGATLQPTALKAHKLEQFDKRYGSGLTSSKPRSKRISPEKEAESRRLDKRVSKMIKEFDEEEEREAEARRERIRKRKEELATRKREAERQERKEEADMVAKVFKEAGKPADWWNRPSAFEGKGKKAGGSKVSGYVQAIVAKKPKYPNFDLKKVKNPSENLKTRFKKEQSINADKFKSVLKSPSTKPKRRKNKT